MSVVAFVPARCGSKSIRLKNIRQFYGQPLLYWVLKALQEAQLVDRVVVATDCDEIIACVDGFGLGKVSIFNRKQENARDESSTEDVMLEFLEDDLTADELKLFKKLVSAHFRSGSRYCQEL